MKQKLSDLLPGEEAIIRGINCGSELGTRLAAMGLVGGNKVLMRRYAPFGGPCEVYIGYDLILRKSEADYILVDKIENKEIK